MHGMELLLTPAELAERLQVPEATLAQWRYLGRGPTYRKVGRFVRYAESDCTAWLETQRVDAHGAA
jgi:hypothetical protein